MTLTAPVEVAPDGALAELSQDPASRKRFLSMMGGAGAAGAFSLLVAACGGSDDTKAGAQAPAREKAKTSGDLAIVNYALTLEYLEADFYAKVAASGLFKGARLDLIKRFGENEAAHVETLASAAKQLGTAARRPKTKFPLKDAKSVLKLAADVENLGAAAYLGQAGRIKNKDILAVALSIHSVEARHAAALNTLLGRSPTPNGAFAKPASMNEVLPVAKKFIVA
jgi:ferritin-like protein